MHAGIATHYCESKRMPALERALLQTKNSQEVDRVLDEFCPNTPLPNNLAKNLNRINECFDGSSVVEILNRLEKDESEWAKKTIKVGAQITLSMHRYLIKTSEIFISGSSDRITAQCEYNISSAKFGCTHDT